LFFAGDKELWDERRWGKSSGGGIAAMNRRFFSGTRERSWGRCSSTNSNGHLTMVLRSVTYCTGMTAGKKRRKWISTLLKSALAVRQMKAELLFILRTLLSFVVED
jgi:hypothetical protein